MKANRIIYWLTTGLVAAGMGMSSVMYLTSNQELVKAFAAIGLPSWLMFLLGTAKLLGAIALVAPRFPRVREWAYAGFAFVFIGAVWAHLATGTPFIAPLMFLVLLALSYFFLGKVRHAQAANSHWATA